MDSFTTAVLSSFLLACAALGRPVHAQAQSDRYVLEAKLDPAARRVVGSAAITFHNRSERALHELVFHLYANAFANEHTVFMRETGTALRKTQLTQTGGIEIRSLRTDAGIDLLSAADRALVQGDATQMRVPLPSQLPPGAEIVVLIEFVVSLPSIVARMGQERDFMMVAQWFPKLAHLERDGSFASYPYHGLGEFYADFAAYDLTVEVPDAYVIAAPGVQVERRATDAHVQRERYRLEPALDVAFAAYPAFRATRGTSGRVALEVYAEARDATLAEGQVALLVKSLARLEARLGSYPYDRLVLVLPPSFALGAGGMEYPGLIVGWPSSPWTALSPFGDTELGMVTTHELAHQWFPMLLASDEVTAPVLDEGLAQWVGIELIDEDLGRPAFQRLLGVPLDFYEFLRIGLSRATPSSLLPAPQYKPSELGPAVYQRPALALETVARTFGRARLWSTLGAYARENRFSHPTLDTFFAAFDAAYGASFSAQMLKPALEGKSVSTRLVEEDRASPRNPRLTAVRDAEAGLPLMVEWASRTGGRAWTRWPGTTRSVVAPNATLRSASIDPERKNLLDVDRRDDQLSHQVPSTSDALPLRLLLLAYALLGLIGL